MKKYIGYYEEVVPHVLCKDIINYGFNFKPSTYSNHQGKKELKEPKEGWWDERVRMEEVWLLENDKFYSDLKVVFNRVIREYSKEHELFSCKRHTDFRLNKYIEGGFMSKHCDNIHHSHGQEYGFPQVSALLFLNDDYDGGEFVVADKVYNTKKGSGIIFPSNFMFPHEVKPITKGIRWSVVTWLM